MALIGLLLLQEVFLACRCLPKITLNLRAAAAAIAAAAAEEDEQRILAYRACTHVLLLATCMMHALHIHTEYIRPEEERHAERQRERKDLFVSVLHIALDDNNIQRIQKKEKKRGKERKRESYLGTQNDCTAHIQTHRERERERE